MAAQAGDTMQTFFSLLDTPLTGAVFNPWVDRDVSHETTSKAPQIRRGQLRAYLEERRGAKILLIAEALGYQGGHFTGIPMTSERLVLGHLEHKGLRAEMVCSAPFTRTSKEKIKPLGFTEPTCTIVWGALHTLGIDPRAVCLWNAFPWHPYKPEKGLLSNRTPGDDEVLSGLPVLQELLRLLPEVRIFAVGKKSAALLTSMGHQVPCLRHPANGGAGAFRRQLGALL